MREIKLRGKRPKSGKWVYGSLVWSPDSGVAPDIFDWETREYASVDPATVGQYTGRKDKNGVEIYEGDVVRYNTGEVWFVEWDSKQAAFVYKNRIIADGDGRHKPSGIGYGQVLGMHEVEVVGNIYANPELLKEAV